MTTFAEMIEQKMQHLMIPGLAVGVARQGAPTYTAGFGYRNIAEQLPVDAETIFGIASVTKSFTCLAIMQLADAGKLSVDDPVVKWLPEFKLPDPAHTRAVAIHHLMTHSSGLPGLPSIFHARAGSVRQDPDWKRLGTAIDPFKTEPIRTYGELMGLMAETEIDLLGAPGSRFNYSNEGYALLQGIIERASGQPFIAYMQERVLSPLGMERSVWRTEDLVQFENVAELYGAAAEGGKKVLFHSPVWWDVADIYTNGSLKSTVSDLLRYLEVYRTLGLGPGGVRIASEAAVRRMITPHVQMPTGKWYGYGLQVQRDYHGATLVGHGGGIKGVASHVAVAIEPGVTAVCLTNLANLPAEDVSMGGLNDALGLAFGAHRRAFPSFSVDASELAQYEGHYRSLEGGAAKVFIYEGALHLEQAGAVLPLRPYEADGFVSTDGITPVKFLRKADGTLSGLFMGVRVLERVR